jgi:hypothetical protein
MRPRLLLRLGLALALTFPGAARVPDPPAVPQDAPCAWGSYQDCLAEIQKYGSDLPAWIVRSAPLSYLGRRPAYDPSGHPVLDPQGQPASLPVTLSGRVFFPPAWRVAASASLPLVVYAHATELKKDAVPSVFGGAEWMLGAAAAAWFGFAVAMPDLPGAGADAGAYHPYCNAVSLAWAVADSIPAAGQTLAAQGCAWDGTLFLMGYSEGGYTALATVKELETHPGSYPALAGSACMAGPFDLSGAMRATFIDPAVRYPRSYYLPYFVLGYHAVYGPRLDPLEVFAPVLLADGSDGNILAWADGSQDGLVVDAEVGRRLGQPADAISLRAMFNPPWLARELLDPAYAASATHALLAENDLWGGWLPTRPILFRHSPDDVNVPYANTQITLDRLGQAIQQTGKDPGSILFSMPIGQAGDHISHTEGALIAIPSAFAWFYFGMPPLQSFVRMRW